MTAGVNDNYENSGTGRPVEEALCRIELFGGIRVIHQGGTFTQFRTQKAAHLLAYLALYRQRPHSREQIVTIFWPDLDEAEGRNNLSTVLSYLRPCLRIPGISPDRILMVDRQHLQLDLHTVATDIGAFYAAADAVRRARNVRGKEEIHKETNKTEQPNTLIEKGKEWAYLLEQAILVATGEILPGCYEEWAIREQSHYHEVLGGLLRQWMELLLMTGRWEEVLLAADRAITLDPYEEAPHQIRMRALMALGRHTAVHTTYLDLTRRLKQELGIEPGAMTRALAEESRRQALHVTHEAAPVSLHATSLPVSPVLSARAEIRQNAPIAPSITLPGDSSDPPHRNGIVPTPIDVSITAPREEGQSIPQPGNLPQISLEINSETVRSPISPTIPEVSIRLPAGGAVPLDSSFYIERTGDAICHEAIRQQHSIVLVKGVRQMGKTSLLARGLQRARQNGFRVVHTDLQKLNRAQLETPDALFLALAGSLALQLGLPAPHRSDWEADLGANMNMEVFLYEQVLGRLTEPLVWALDQVDRLFTCPFGSEVFALFRSWHNERSLNPDGFWARLTLVIAYATEAHLLISDVNRSPFNVGTRLELKGFTHDQLEDLNRRCGSPLTSITDLERFHALTAGQPYLAQCGLKEMMAGVTLSSLIETADQDEGPFGDHLRRLLTILTQDADLLNIVRGLLEGHPCPDSDSFYRLRSAGLLIGERRNIQFHCPMYASYLRRHL